MINNDECLGIKESKKLIYEFVKAPVITPTAARSTSPRLTQNRYCR